MYNHLLNINNELDIKMLLSDENKQKNTVGQFSFLLLFVCFQVFSFSNGVYGLLYKNTVKTKLTNQSGINSFIKKAHNR